MSGMWTKTLVYLGLREEDDDYVAASGYLPDDEHVQRIERPGPTQRVERVEHVERVLPVDPPAHRPAPPVRVRDDDDWGIGLRDDDDSSSLTDAALADSGRIARIGSGNVRPLRPEESAARGVGLGAAASVRIVQVGTFEDCEAIGSRYRMMQPVLFNVSGADKATGRRVLDFVSGLTYASHGTLRKVGKGAFLLLPDGVELSADERRRLSGFGYEVSPEPRP
jgi:cell division inhibitor SepF